MAVQNQESQTSTQWMPWLPLKAASSKSLLERLSKDELETHESNVQPVGGFLHPCRLFRMPKKLARKDELQAHVLVL
eukprot:scaffold283766_cov17-Tisochrysis_lutea.AAC.1